MTEEDADFQEEGEDNGIQLTDEFKEDLREEKCECCAMIDVLCFFKNDEIKGIKDYENDVVKQTKEYLNTFNRYGINVESLLQQVDVKLKFLLD